MKTLFCQSYVVSLLVLFAGAYTNGGEALVATRIASDLDRPIFVTSPPGDNERLFIAEQHTGRIRILDLETNAIQPDPFLDLSGLSTGGEQGLLGLAFHPDYATNGLFYVNLTDTSGRTNVRSYSVSSNDPNVADTSSAQTMLRFSQPEGNHNAGWLGFGPNDDYLYIATGDGGGANDRHGSNGNSQDITNNLLGKILRVDVNGDAFPNDANRNYEIPSSNPFANGEGDDEIWSYGLRNPWRASFDRQTGDFYIGDVGQGEFEEVDFQSHASTGGENYGWRLREGTIRTPGVGGDAPPGAIDPIFEYPHNTATGGFSITGGYVYRGPIQELDGQYFAADYVSNNIWTLKHDGETTTDIVLRDDIMTDEGTIRSVSSFGEDNSGNLYIVSLDGDIFRLSDVIKTSEIVPAGSDWRFLDDGSDQGNAWIDPNFDDSSWAIGPAQLGYGENDEATQLSFGSNSNDKHITTYFRHEFTVDDLSDISSLQLGFLRDDGGAVYLNGNEIARSDNLPANAGFDTVTTSSTAGGSERTFFAFNVDSSLLLPGRNVLAAEVHQRSGTSSDLSFDLRLIATLSDTEAFSCDFDGDGACNIADLDLLTSSANLVAGETTTANTEQFDLDRNGSIDRADLDQWLSDAATENGFSGRFLSGDANLDGTVDATDLNALGRNWQQNSGTWSSGDFTGDEIVDASDLNDIGRNWQQSVAPAAVAVPEPSGLYLSMLWLGVFALRRHQATA